MIPIDAIEEIEDIPVGVPVIVEGGLVVTVIKKHKGCIRKVYINLQIQLTKTHYPGN